MQFDQEIKINNFSVSRFNEIYLPTINRDTFERLDSYTLFNHEFKKTLFEDNKLHIIIGTDSGLLANYVIEQTLPVNAKYIFVELQSVLNVLSIDIPEQLSNQVEVVCYERLGEILKQEQNEIFIIQQNYVISRSLASKMESSSGYLLLTYEVENLLHQLKFKLRLALSTTEFLKRQLDNIAENHTQANVFADKFCGKSCVVLGGGPSLDRELDWIKLNKDKLLIIAVSRIALKLHKYGITPDIIVCVDPQTMNFDVNTGIFSLTDSTILVNAYHVCSNIISQWSGQSAYLGERFPWNEGNNIKVQAPTVTNSSIHLAIKMGCSRIILAGVDFCYSPQGLTHASGTEEAKAGPCLDILGEWVETYNGDQSETPLQLHHAMKSLAKEVERYPDIEFINLSENAAKIVGVEHKKSADIAITKEQSIDRHSVSLLTLIPDRGIKEVNQDISCCIKEVKQQIKQLNNIQGLVNKAISHIERIISGKGEISKSYNKIEKIETELKTKYLVLSNMLKYYGYYHFTRFLTTQNEQRWEQQQSNFRTKQYYQAYHDTNISLVEHLNLCLKKLVYRQNELLSPVNMEHDLKKPFTQKLVSQWQEFDEIGRVHTWLKYHHNQLDKLSIEDKSIIENAQDLFMTGMEQVNRYRNVIKPANEQLKLAISKVLLLVNNKNINGLAKMENYLLPFIGSSELAYRLYHLTISFRYQLCHQYEKGIEHILLIPEQYHNETEWSQLIVMALKLHKLDLAESMLVKITAVNPQYLPQYAHILRLRGKVKQAIDVYVNYLESFPDDVPVWLKLGLFMVDLNQQEGAETAFSQVLALEPNNQLAQKYLCALQSQ